jgi:hypothetical protein
MHFYFQTQTTQSPEKRRSEIYAYLAKKKRFKRVIGMRLAFILAGEGLSVSYKIMHPFFSVSRLKALFLR